MNFLNLASMLIHGYELLPVSIRAAFETTEAGEELCETTKRLERNLDAAENKNIFSKLHQLISPKILISREEHIEHARAYWQFTMRSSTEYRHLLDQIHQVKAKLAFHTALLKQIENTYFKVLQTTWENQASILNLDLVNAQHAKMLTKNGLTDKWLQLYEMALLNNIVNGINYINGKEPFPKPPLISKKRARDSLSNLYAYMCSVRNNQKEVKWCVDALYETSDVHAFLQSTGFATQNETSWLAGFDLVNYFRMSGQVAETKSMLSKFIQPFAPLYYEYSSINKEQNMFRQIFRTVMPMLIVSATVILVSALLSCFVIPEIAFLFILIPTLYLGLVVASSYIIGKDWVYNDLQQRKFGGPFKVPAYMTNDGMIASFGNETKADKVRDFYVNEISICRNKETAYQTKVKLTQDDIESRERNTDRERVLQFEWYDIHSNPKMSSNTVVELALSRLHRDGREAYEAIQKTLHRELEYEIPAFIHDTIIEKVKTSLKYNIRPSLLKLKPSNLKDAEHHCFFARPASFKHRENIERLKIFQDELNLPYLSSMSANE